MFSLYLTGAPATGKSTVARAVAARTNGKYLSYGGILTDSLSHLVENQAELRAKSSLVISQADVLAADALVERVITEASGESNVVVDSHAITREPYGFRAIPYGFNQWAKMPYTHIVCLWASRDVIRSRIASAADGRPLLTDDEFDMHSQLQSSLALTYAHTGGVSIAFINSAVALDEVIERVIFFVEAD